MRHAAVKKVPKGKTLGEIEADEGGVVKESLVGMAQTKRAAQRKQAHIEGTLYVSGLTSGNSAQNSLWLCHCAQATAACSLHAQQ